MEYSRKEYNNNIHYLVSCYPFFILFYLLPMNIHIDTRESGVHDKLVALSTGNTLGINLQVAPLLIGDFTLEMNQTQLIVFERKSLLDLASSIKDGRYEEQSFRLIHTSGVHPHNIVYIIEGMFSTLRSDADRKMCLSAMTSLSYYKGFSVVRTCSANETAEFIYSTASKILRETNKGHTPAFLNAALESATPLTPSDVPAEVAPPSIPAYCSVASKVKKDNITPENIGEIILCTIPGISSTTALELMRPYSSFAAFLEDIHTNPNKLESVYLETAGKRRKLGKNIIENIHRFLGKHP